MVKKKFNVMVVGLTGVKDDDDYRVGKSLFCNRFVRPSFDDLVEKHDSIYEEQYIYGPVINRENFLYWGTVSMLTELSDDPVEFLIIEYTNLRSLIDSSIDINKYVDEAIVDKVKSKNKLMYINPHQVRNYKSYKEEIMPNCVKIDGYIIVYNLDPNVSIKTLQDGFLSKAIKRLESLNKTFVIAASKCDLLSDRSNITDRIKLNIKNLHLFQNREIRIIETSSLLNVNIVAAFQLLYSTFNQDKMKCKLYHEALRALENRQTRLLDSFTSIILNSEEPLKNLTFENLFDNKFKYTKLKNIVELIGTEGAKHFYNQVIQTKVNGYKEKILQYCLSKFEQCLLDTVKDVADLDKILSVENFSALLKAKQVFDSLFETTKKDLDNYTYIEDFLLRLDPKNHLNPPKIPTSILRNERFQVLLDKHSSYLRSLSREQKTKQIWENALKKLINSNKFTIDTPCNVVQGLVISMLDKKYSLNVLDTSFKDLYDFYSHRMLLKSKYELHELMFEHSDVISRIDYESKAQMVKDVSEVIKDDPRYKILENGHQTLRGNWIFSHFTFFRSNTYCLLSPLAVCVEKQAATVLSSMFDQCVNVLELIDADEMMILFVICSDYIYDYFQAEFLKLANVDECMKYYMLYINGNCRRVVPVKISSSNVNWEEIFMRYSDSKFSFVAIYGDAATLKFVETVLVWKDKHSQKDSDFNVQVQRDVNSVAGPFMMSNISVIVCLMPQIVEDYKKFLSESGDSTFIQETMLGRLVELGRNIAGKYNAKFVEPYLEDIMNKSNVSTLHELQINDSVKYLEEVLYDKPDSLQEKYSEVERVKIIMCCMCGDNYPIEIIIGMLLYDKKYEYSNRRQTVYYEMKFGEKKILIVLKILSYHSAFVLQSLEKYHGCLCVYKMNRECSWKMMKFFASQTKIENFQVIGISGELSHARISLQKTLTLEELISIERKSFENVQTENMNMSNHVELYSQFLQKAFERLKLDVKLADIGFRMAQSKTIRRENKYGTFQLKKGKKIGVLSEIEGKKVSVSSEVNSRSTEFANQLHVEDIDTGFRCESTGDIGVDTRNRRQPGTIGSTFKTLKDITSKIFYTSQSKTAESIETNKNDEQQDLRTPTKEARVSLNEAERSKAMFTSKLRNTMSAKKKPKSAQEKKAMEWEKHLNQQKNAAKYNYFGKALKTICNENIVPVFIIKCVTLIETNYIDMEGLYRKSGSRLDIETVRMAFEADHNVDFSTLGFSAHIFAGALKSFFTLLPESFIPENFLPDIVESTSVAINYLGESNPELRISKLKYSMSKLSMEVRETLKYLIRHLSNVSMHKDKNKMDARNLSICFWPSLIKFTPTNNIKIVQQGDNILFCLYVHTLIENYSEIFEDKIESLLDANIVGKSISYLNNSSRESDHVTLI